MSKKIYTSKSEISIKVLLDNGKTVRVAFTPRTMGSSVYMTDDAELQKAIESHKEYGKLFVCKNAGQVITATASQPTDTDAALVGGTAPTAGQQTSDNGQRTTANGQQTTDGEGQSVGNIKEVVVGSIQEAKDYLADKFDLSRTSLRNREAIESAALAHGIVFVGLKVRPNAEPTTE